MNESSKPIREVLVSWKEGKVDLSTLLRALVGHAEWAIPISSEAARQTLETNSEPDILFSEYQGRRRLLVFTDSDAFGVYLGKAPGNDEIRLTITFDGKRVFSPTFGEFDAYFIDPNNAHAIVLTQEEIAAAATFGDAVAVEASLSMLRAGTARDEEQVRSLTQHIAAYPKYQLALQKVSDRFALAMAPDDSGRSLAAVFTHDDTADRFRSAAQQAGFEVQTTSLDGMTLFQQLRQMGLDGVVFNCMGPIAPVAFSSAIADIILSGS
jgi:hypothetical protein